MTDDMRPVTVQKGVVVLLSALILVSAAQSLFLFKLWRDMPRERVRAVTSLADKAVGDEKAEGTKTDEGTGGNAQSPPSRMRGAHPLFGDPDEFWRDWDMESWDPLEEFSHIRERMDSLFDDSFGRLSLTPGGLKRNTRSLSFSPSLDLQDKGDHYVARMDIPGTDKSNLSVKLEDRTLTVSGQINEAAEQKAGDHVIRKERRSGKFERSVTLPGAVAADAMKANYENGVLTITIPKVKDTNPSRTVPVQ